MSSNLEGRATHDMNKVGQGVALYLGHRQLKEGRTPDSFLGRYPPTSSIHNKITSSSFVVCVGRENGSTYAY